MGFSFILNNTVMKPSLQVLTEYELQKITREAISLLENPGIRVLNGEGLELLSAAGAKINHTDMIASIPERIIHDDPEKLSASILAL